MHGLAHFQHQVVGQVGQQVNGPAAAVKQADAHVYGAYLFGDVAHLQAGVAQAELRVLNLNRDRVQPVKGLQGQTEGGAV